MSRMPIVAGTFYEATASACRRTVHTMLEQAKVPDDLPEKCVGGLVPHAGWTCSGTVAATTFKALQRCWTGQTILLVGAVHAYAGHRGMLYASGSWKTPIGEVAIDSALAEEVLARCPDVISDSSAHRGEHSLEVQLPFIQVLWPKAKILPLMVPPSPLAPGIGRQVGDVLAEKGQGAVTVIGSTDLTHYGPRYGITPAGVGKQGIAWATENDRRLLRLVERMSAEEVVNEAAEHLNACGGGAVSATIAIAAAMGATRGIVLRHTNSYETLKSIYPSDMADAVGYASVVFA